jgi:hypothetical protein
MYNLNKIYSFQFWCKVFNKVNLSKVFIIFIIGLISRGLINYIYDVNVFMEYTTGISLLYYTFMTFAIVLVHELVNYFNISIIRYEILLSFIRKVFSVMNDEKLLVSGDQAGISSSYKNKLSNILSMNDSNKGESTGNKETEIGKSCVNKSSQEITEDEVSEEEVRKY